jgi:hypothetical protein
LDTSGWPARAYNAVRVTVSRDSSHAGGELDLFFAPVLGSRHAAIRAAATSAFVMGTVTPRGNQGQYRGALLPFTYQVDEWNALMEATSPGMVTAANGVTVTLSDNYTVDPQSTDSSGVSSGADGKLEVKMFPNRTTSGNYGTINFSSSSVGNSTSVLRDLIVNGPNESDWPDLPEIVEATPTNPVPANGDTGLSAGMESTVAEIIGQPHILPLYSTVAGTGNNTFFNLVGFVPVTITAVRLNGSENSYITFQPHVMSRKSSIDGLNQVFFEVTPSADPDPMFLGARSLVR